MSVIVVELITLGAIVSGPDGSQATPPGGRMFRYGRKEAGREDGFRLGPAPDEGVPLPGRVTGNVGPAVLARYRRAAR